MHNLFYRSVASFRFAFQLIATLLSGSSFFLDLAFDLFQFPPPVFQSIKSAPCGVTRSQSKRRPKSRERDEPTS
jgi:hypothetical protein